MGEALKSPVLLAGEGSRGEGALAVGEAVGLGAVEAALVEVGGFAAVIDALVLVVLGLDVGLGIGFATTGFMVVAVAGFVAAGDLTGAAAGDLAGTAAGDLAGAAAGDLADAVTGDFAGAAGTVRDAAGASFVGVVDRALVDVDVVADNFVGVVGLAGVAGVNFVGVVDRSDGVGLDGM